MPMLPKGGPYWSLIRDSKKADKLAQKCIGCSKNNNSWCLLNNGWCSKFKRICEYNKQP